MSKSVNFVDIKKRRRLSKFTFNMLLSSEVEINEDQLSNIIEDIFQKHISVNLKIRPNESLIDNIKSLEPSLINFDNKNYQFILNISSYTVLIYSYSDFALELNRIFKLPIGCIKIQPLKKNEMIQFNSDNNNLINQIDDDLLNQNNNDDLTSQLEDNELLNQLESDKLPDQIEELFDNQINDDEEISLKIPDKYIEAAEEFENIISTGKSSIPQIPILDEGKNQNEEGFSLQNLLMGIGGLLIGIKLGTPIDTQKSNPMFI